MSLRRLFASSARVASSVQEAAASSANLPSQSTVEASHLPPVLFRYIMHQLENRPEPIATDASGAVEVQNPFLVSSRPRDSTPDADHKVYSPPVIPRRRQKQLMQMYPPHMLPPSPDNPQEQPAAVQWMDGTVISWTGSYQPKDRIGVYANRRVMFKGTKAERERDTRKKEREDRMAGMEKRVSDWRKNKVEEKTRSKSSLPF